MSRWDGRRGGGIHHVLAGVLLVSAASSVHKIAPVELNMVFLCSPESVRTHITEPAAGIYILSLKCYATPERTVLGNIPWEKPYLSSAPWRKERVEEQVKQPGGICCLSPPSSTKDQKGRMFVIVRTTERAEKETPTHTQWRRKALTIHHNHLGHKKPEARGQITNQSAKSSLISSSCAQFFTVLNWFEGAEPVLIRVSWTTLVYFVTARLPAL